MAGCWQETSSALHGLETLLRCPLCNRTMSDPCDLDNCDHHFCRPCILEALTGCNSVCPECGLPSWVRDVKPNRQLETLIRLVHSMRGMTDGTASTRPCSSHTISHGSTSAPADTRGEGTTARPSDKHREAFDSPQKRAESPRGSNSTDTFHGFQRPVAEPQLLRRRQKAMSSSHRDNCIPQSESGHLGAGRSAQDHPVHQGILRPPLLPVNHPRTKTRSVDNMAGEQVPDKDGLSGSFPYMEVRTCETSAAGQENPGGTGSTLGRNLFGQPKTRRRKTVPVKLVGRVPPDISIAFPFSPLVTKTRDYAKLDSAAKVQRLQRSGHALETIKRPSTVQGEGPRTKRLHQQRMEEFVYRDPPTSKGKAPPHSLPKAKGNTLQGESPIPATPSSTHARSPVPATPSSTHARTMRRNIRGETPLHIAAIKGDMSAVRVLLSQGADPNAKDHAGWTPLHESCNHGNVGVATLLLDHGALVNVPGFENDTPLHDAVSNGHLAIASLLVSRGANLGMRNRRGLTPIDLAVSDLMRQALTRTAPSPDLRTCPSALRSPHASPSLGGGPCQVVLLATGLKGYQKAQMEELADLLGAQVVSIFSPEVSHVVTLCDSSRCCPRTLKFLFAVALGKWIVSFQWITRCLQEHGWVDETPYEVMGVTVGESVVRTEAPRKGRENAINKAPGLFDGCQFYFSSSPPLRLSREELSNLVRLAGGQVLTREPKAITSQDSLASVEHRYPYHARPGSIFSESHQIVVYEQTAGHRVPGRVKDAGVATAPASWILDCLSYFELLDLPH